jgi:hypothetical protein
MTSLTRSPGARRDSSGTRFWTGSVTLPLETDLSPRQKGGPAARVNPVTRPRRESRARSCAPYFYLLRGCIGSITLIG